MSGITKKNIDQAIKFVYSDNNSLSVIFHDNDLLMGVVGEFNKNLQELEKITKCSLYSRGNSILIKSDPETNEKVKNAIQFLVNQFINNGSDGVYVLYKHNNKCNEDLTFYEKKKNFHDPQAWPARRWCARRVVATYCA